MRIAYLINQYPKVSHSFIRREILALETLGFDVKRVSIRPCDNDLIDDQDKTERLKTKSLLKAGPIIILMSIFSCLITSPVGVFRALGCAVKLSRKSERGLLIHLIYVAEATLLNLWMKKWKIKHLHAHFGTNPTTVAMLCSLIGGTPYSFTSHGSDEQDNADSIGLTDKIINAKFVAAVCSFGRSVLFRKCSASLWDKIKIVHCGVDETYLNCTPTPVPDNNRLVCVGRLCEHKGQQLLIQATANLIAKGIIFELVLVGDGEMRAEIEAMLIALNIQQHVRITGWADGETVRKELQQSRGMVLPSFTEGLPVVIMEAFALGRPVISTYVAGIPELVKPGESGWLCPASDVDTLTEAMEQLLSMPTDQLTQMGLKGRKLVTDNHDARLEAKVLAAAIQSHTPPTEETVS